MANFADANRSHPVHGNSPPPHPAFSSLAKLGVLLALSGLVAMIGTQFGPGAWYDHIAKPAWNPPNWVFGPVWTALYVLMAVAAWRVWRKPATQAVDDALFFYGVQLALNAIWSPMFFGLQNPLIALMDIVLLLAVAGVTTAMFWRIDRVAGMLFLPYAAWVAFATALNAAVWSLNRVI